MSRAAQVSLYILPVRDAGFRAQRYVLRNYLGKPAPKYYWLAATAPRISGPRDTSLSSSYTRVPLSSTQAPTVPVLRDGESSCEPAREEDRSELHVEPSLFSALLLVSARLPLHHHATFCHSRHAIYKHRLIVVSTPVYTLHGDPTP